MKKIETTQAPQAIGPYSQAVEVQGFLFGSGQIPVDPQTGEVSNTIEEQAHQVFKNISAVLQGAGLSLNHVVKTTLFLTDLSHFQQVNEIYTHYFKEPYPARSCVEVQGLPKNVLIEAEYIAVTKK